MAFVAQHQKMDLKRRLLKYCTCIFFNCLIFYANDCRDPESFQLVPGLLRGETVPVVWQSVAQADATPPTPPGCQALTPGPS